MKVQTYCGLALPANGRVTAQACVCKLWAVAWLAGGSGSVTRAH